MISTRSTRARRLDDDRVAGGWVKSALPAVIAMRCARLRCPGVRRAICFGPRTLFRPPHAVFTPRARWGTSTAGRISGTHDVRRCAAMVQRCYAVSRHATPPAGYENIRDRRRAGRARFVSPGHWIADARLCAPCETPAKCMAGRPRRKSLILIGCGYLHLLMESEKGRIRRQAPRQLTREYQGRVPFTRQRPILNIRRV
jgi:hypothetical protein